MSKECTLRVHQQLECEKSRHESSKKELEHVKKDYDDFLRDLGASKDIQNPSVEGDGSSKIFALVREREKKKVTLDFEARLAAEEKARIYEASAEVKDCPVMLLPLVAVNCCSYQEEIMNLKIFYRERFACIVNNKKCNELAFELMISLISIRLQRGGCYNC